MARRTAVFLVDDLDGTNIPVGKGETITFALDGRTYEMDLTRRHATALRRVMRPYIAAGRRVQTRRSAGTTHMRVGAESQSIRAWARAHGYEVNDRGRIPNQIRAAFDAAN